MGRGKKFLETLFIIIIIMLYNGLPALCSSGEKIKDTTPPVISVWYGDRQSFGQHGDPQQWINILGSVRDIESDIDLLTYTLNGKPGYTVLGVPGKLMVGPFPVKSDPRRLYYKGDFIIDMDKDDLKDGLNEVVITAKNGAGLETKKTVTVEYEKGNVWELPYHIDWNSVDDAQDVVQFVDGLWIWNSSGIRPVRPAYDRLFAVGDMTWKNYEVLMPVTLHSYDEKAFRSQVSNQAGIGFILRWQGHCDKPKLSIPCYQPKCGWLNMGSLMFYFFRLNRADYISIYMEGDRGYTVNSRAPVLIEPEKSYWFRARVKTDGNGHNYYLKVWEAGYAEPEEWSLTRLGEKDGLKTGSFLMILHHVDATIGNISITPVE